MKGIMFSTIVGNSLWKSSATKWNQGRRSEGKGSFGHHLRQHDG